MSLDADTYDSLGHNSEMVWLEYAVGLAIREARVREERAARRAQPSFVPPPSDSYAYRRTSERYMQAARDRAAASRARAREGKAPPSNPRLGHVERVFVDERALMPRQQRLGAAEIAAICASSESHGKLAARYGVTRGTIAYHRKRARRGAA